MKYLARESIAISKNFESKFSTEIHAFMFPESLIQSFTKLSVNEQPR